MGTLPRKPGWPASRLAHVEKEEELEQDYRQHHRAGIISLIFHPIIFFFFKQAPHITWGLTS